MGCNASSAPLQPQTIGQKVTLIVGDIGGTNLRLASIVGTKMTNSRYYKTRDHPTLISAIKDFISAHNIQNIKGCCLAMAGPVDGENCTLTNENTSFSYNATTFTTQLNFKTIFINDFQAIGWWIISRFVAPDSVRVIVDNEVKEGTKLYIGAGTGLGVGYVIGSTVYPCEGGHLRFSPFCDIEFELVEFLKTKIGSGHVSYERLVSGMGIAAVAQFFSEKTQKELFDYVGFGHSSNDLVGDFLTLPDDEAQIPAVISVASKKNITAKMLMSVFFNFYGRAISDLCAGFLPGEIFIAGGIMAKNMFLMDDSDIKKRFNEGLNDKGRLSHVVTSRKVSVILEENIGLFGCAECMMKYE